MMYVLAILAGVGISAIAQFIYKEIKENIITKRFMKQMMTQESIRKIMEAGLKDEDNNS